MVEIYFWHEYLGFAAKMPEPPGIRSKPTGRIPTKFAGKKKGTTNAMKETVTYQQKWAIVTHYRQHGIAQTLAAYYPNAQGKHREHKRKNITKWARDAKIQVLAANNNTKTLRGYRAKGVSNTLICEATEFQSLGWIFGIKRLDFSMSNLIYLF